MKCDWTDHDERDERNRRLVRCLRCGLIPGGRTPHPFEKIDADCQGWPRWHEWGYWIALILEAIGMSKRRWAWIKRQLNLVEPSGCSGCEAREKWLNSLGGRAVMLYRRVFVAKESQSQ